MSDLIVGPLRGLAVARRAHRNDHRDRGDQSTRGHCVRLMSVPGVGPLISTAVVAAIGTGEAFDRGRDFGAWLGAGAAQYSTGGRSILGGISKRGSRYLRTLFIQAAKVLLMRPQNWRKFSFGPWLTNAAPRMHRNKLATALANKLVRIAWSVLNSERLSTPTSNSRLSSRPQHQFATETLHGTDRYTCSEPGGANGFFRNLSANEANDAFVYPSRPRPARRSNRPDTYLRLPLSTR